MEYVKQTGVLFKYDPRDYRVGASPLTPAPVNPIGDWRKWRPSDEVQFAKFTFDTMACVSFSALNDVESTLNFFKDNGKMSAAHLAWFEQNGYIDNGKFNLSDRFTSIMSGTTPQGNYPQNVWDSIRLVGCIPDKMLPFGGNDWAEYHDKKLITPAMIALAKEFLTYVESAYEWANVNTDQLAIALKQCPMQIIINGGSHAVALLEQTHIFDTYPPFLGSLNSPISYGLKGIVRLKARVLKLGMKGEDVKQLQTDLNALGYPVGIADGVFGAKTDKGLKSFQKAYKLVADGIAGTLTLAKIAELKKNPSFGWGLLPLVGRRADAFVQNCAAMGYKIRITSGFRTKDEQEKLYQQGRTTAGKIVTNVRYPKSLHCHGLAFDIAFIGSNPYPSDDKKWKRLAEIAQSIGLTAGYTFTTRDRPHFEFKGKYTYQQIYDFNYDKADFL